MSADAEPMMVASGVRSSCDTESSSAVRIRSDSAVRWRQLRFLAELDAGDARWRPTPPNASNRFSSSADGASSSVPVRMTITPKVRSSVRRGTNNPEKSFSVRVPLPVISPCRNASIAIAIADSLSSKP